MQQVHGAGVKSNELLLIVVSRVQKHFHYLARYVTIWFERGRDNIEIAKFDDK